MPTGILRKLYFGCILANGNFKAGKSFLFFLNKIAPLVLWVSF